MPHSSIWLNISVAFAIGSISFSCIGSDWFPYKVESVDPPFGIDSARKSIDYTPVPRAIKPWRLCVSFPHLADSYWAGVNYGVAEEAKRSGVSVNFYQAGGYGNVSRQAAQIEDCMAKGADALIVSAVSQDGLDGVLKTAARNGIPVIDLVNGIKQSQLISAKSLVSFYDMGKSIGEYIASRHPRGSKFVKVAWFPGPAEAGWVIAAHQGFMEGVKGGAVVVLEPRYGDTKKDIQAGLINESLIKNPDVSYVVGTAITADAAQSVLRTRNLTGSIQVLSFYMSPEVYMGIASGKILASPADSMVVQGRIAVDQAIRVLERKPYTKHAAPQILIVDKGNFRKVRFLDILPPPMFSPVMKVE